MAHFYLWKHQCFPRDEYKHCKKRLQEFVPSCKRLTTEWRQARSLLYIAFPVQTFKINEQRGEDVIFVSSAKYRKVL